MNSATLRIFSFAKINLALSVLGKRADGYHEIRTVFQSIDLCDTIAFCSAPELRLVSPDLAIPEEDNLVLRAARALAGAAKVREGAEITLRKRIPASAGLGGGSGNAAATLRGLTRFWKLNPTEEELYSIAAGLGSDVPFFLQGGTALGIGRGEEIYALPDLARIPLVVVFPGVSVPTSEAYHSLGLGLTSTYDTSKISGFCRLLATGSSGLAQIFNDFETPILSAFPAIRDAKNFLIRQGATAVMLSGSGSSIFGFFDNEESALATSRKSVPESWRVFPAKTLSRAEYLLRMFG